MRNTLKFIAAALLLAGCSSGGVSGDGSVSGAVKLGGDPAPAGTVVVLTGWSSGSAKTDASGTYTFSKLHDGDYAVLVELPSTVEQRQIVQVTVAKGGATSAPDLTFTGLGSISGTVQLSGGPAAGVPVTADGAGVALTDSAGHFSLQNVPVGAHTVSASIPGGARASAQVTVAYKQDASATLTLGASGSISGTVQISGATDASGVGVDLVGPRTASATTDASGAFEFDSLPDGHYLLMAHGSGLFPASASASADVSNGQGPSALSLAFSPVGSVAGTVTLDGTPAGGAVVMVQGTNLAASTGADGTYELDGVPVGAQTLTVALSGATPATSQVTVTRGQSVAGSVDLAPVTGPATLEGVATVVGGAPASGGTAALGTGAAQALDGNGGYLLPGVDSQLSPLTLHGADPAYQETIPLVLALPGNDGQYLGGGTVQPLGPIELQRGVRAVDGTCIQVNNLAPDGAEALVATQPGQCFFGPPSARANAAQAAGPGSSGAEYRVLADGRTFPLAGGTLIPDAAYYAPNSDQVLYGYPNVDMTSGSLHESLLDGTDVELTSHLRLWDYSFFFNGDGTQVAFWTDPAGLGDSRHMHLNLADVATGTPHELASDVMEGQLWFAGTRLVWEQVDSSGAFSTWTAASDGSGKHQVLPFRISTNGAFYLDNDGAFAVYRDPTTGHLSATTLDNPSPLDLSPCDDFQALSGGTFVLWRNDVVPAEVQVASITLGSTGITFAAQTALTMPSQIAANRGTALLTSDDGQDLSILYRLAGDRVAIGTNGTFAALPNANSTIGSLQFLSGTRTALTTVQNSPPPYQSLVLDTFGSSLTPTTRADPAIGIISVGLSGRILYTDTSNQLEYDDVVNQSAPLLLPGAPGSARLSDDGLHVFYLSGTGNTQELMELTPPSVSPVDLGAAVSGYSLYFSPDGSKLAYLLDEYQSTGPTLRVASADGSNPQVVAHGACPLAFSADGSALALGSHFEPSTDFRPATRETDIYDFATNAVTPVLGQVVSFFDGCSSLEQPTWLQSTSIIDPRMMFTDQEYQFQSGAYVLPKP